MSCFETESLWAICLNCEHEYTIEDIFTEDGTSECPFCGSKEFRQCDSYGIDIDEYTSTSLLEDWN